MEGVRQSVPDISRKKLVLQEPEASGVFSHARLKKKKEMQPLICHRLLKPGIKGTRAQLKMLIILQRMRTGFLLPTGF